MNPIQQLGKLGQSVWCDNLGRGMLDAGELKRLIDLGVTGVTSNPTIFMKAIFSGDDYDDRISAEDEAGLSVVDLYERLVLPDIADAADLLKPIHDRTDGVDGYVSLEVNPKLAYNPDATVAEARRLYRRLNRPNVLIKVPATEQGLSAIEYLIAEGISVNVTLIFSVAMYKRVMDAYVKGLGKFDATGGDVSRVASVASFFVSRVDSAVDKLLEEKKKAGAKVDDLFGLAAVANAKVAYQRFGEVFDRAGTFARLADRGARVQRPLWASTSTKNPAYPDTKYVDTLIGPDTVNTMPPETLTAALDHAKPARSIDRGLDEAHTALARLGELGISLTAVTDQLTTDGVNAFAKSFDELLDNLKKKRERGESASQDGVAVVPLGVTHKG